MPKALRRSTLGFSITTEVKGLMVTSVPVTVAVPTYRRERVLIDTLDHLLRQDPRAEQLLVMDQTPRHEPDTESTLAEWDQTGGIRWMRLSEPSIPGSMNRALIEAKCPIVLFVDDDIVPSPALIAAHAAAYESSPDIWSVAGQVLQPGESPGYDPSACADEGLCSGLDFSFRSSTRAWVKSVMAGNLSMRRDRAIAVGGFDEQFLGVAYRFETDFCRRIWNSGGRVLFEPAASVRHLRASSGGTRRYGSHLTSLSAVHGVGDYYFALKHGSKAETLAYVARRPVREVCTRFHLRHPWWIPGKLLGEAMAFLWALRLHFRGPKLIESCPPETTESSLHRDSYN